MQKLIRDDEFKEIMTANKNDKKLIEKDIIFEYADTVEWLSRLENFDIYLQKKVEEGQLKKESKKIYLKEIKDVKSFSNVISIEMDLSEIFTWSLDSFEINLNQLLYNPRYKEKKEKGNRKISAPINHFHKFLKEMDNRNKSLSDNNSTGVPENKLPEYRWYWASSLPVLDFNRLDIIIGVTKIILKIGGKVENTEEFKSSLVELEKKLKLKDRKLSKSKSNLSKNVIASAREYWQCPGLINVDGFLTELGIKVGNGVINENQLGLEIIHNLKLPNPNFPRRYTPEIIEKWENFKLEIRPFKLIIEILIELDDREGESYISSDELEEIIIPIAADTPNDINKYCMSLINSRDGSLDYQDWPKYRPKNENPRFPKEFLDALAYWGYLKKDNRNFYLTNKARNVFGKQSVSNKPKNVGKSPKKAPINKIYFGAPGTGKSHKIAQQLTEIDTYYKRRVTFHPDYDNASFLGAYQPISNDNEISYQFVPQIFTNVFLDACNDPNNQYYLIIEEINRGNCSEIFGEIFQLLDRNDKYPITPSEELKEYLNGKIIDSNFYKGGSMLLPDNISILATMNTSDQSLYPMDSAFKRRWDWEYIPISYGSEDENNESRHYVIKIDKEEVKWIEFIKKVNDKISKNPNLGIDKCLGNYFIKPETENETEKKTENEIAINSFINKVIFYLWNDVFKDEPKESIFGKEFLEDNENLTFESFFPIEEGEINLKKIFQKLNIMDEDQ